MSTRGVRSAIIGGSMGSASLKASARDERQAGRGPRYVAIVSDGSARWARAHGITVGAGHAAAADTAIARVADAVDLGIEELTFFAFSTENWARPRREVHALLEMLAERVRRDTATLDDRRVRVRFIGRRDRAGDALVSAIEYAERTTCCNEGMTLFVAFDYGGRDEILAAAERYRGGGEHEFSGLLRASEMHDPDVVIRTSGERRISNFLLWQTAYSELIFRDELWPDFDRAAFEECLAEYSLRRRRFGGRTSVGV